MPTTSRTPTDPDVAHGSAVTLRGRVTGLPEERTLPSGDVLVSFRISVPRRPTPPAAPSG